VTPEVRHAAGAIHRSPREYTQIAPQLPDSASVDSINQIMVAAALVMGVATACQVVAPRLRVPSLVLEDFSSQWQPPSSG
jgi:hypothetical protein